MPELRRLQGAFRPDRPLTSHVELLPDGRQFNLTFLPGQRLPNHHSPSRVIIIALGGAGEIAMGDEPPRHLPPGAVVQVDPGLHHSIVAGPEGLELQVRLVGNCCEAC